MGYIINQDKECTLFENLSKEYDIYAPVIKKGEGCYSDTDVVRYDRIRSFEEIEWNKKSDYSFKEILTPINETLFYFTEHNMTEPELPDRKIMIFLGQSFFSWDCHHVMY